MAEVYVVQIGKHLFYPQSSSVPSKVIRRCVLTKGTGVSKRSLYKYVNSRIATAKRQKEPKCPRI